MKMRAVCLREPWLYLMIDLPPELGLTKNIENRARKLTNQLGPILVKSSASKRDDREYYAGVYAHVESWGWFPMAHFPRFEQLQFGGIRGALNFAELLPAGFVSNQRWHFHDCFGYVVDRYVRFPFRPLKGGGQGIFYTETTNEESELLSAAGLLPESEAE